MSNEFPQDEEAVHCEPGMRKCPWCGTIIFKPFGSNDVLCNMCGKRFCDYCGLGPCEETNLYEHGVDAAPPPAFRKYRCGEPVSYEGLNEFYKKYPNIKADTC